MRGAVNQAGIDIPPSRWPCLKKCQCETSFKTAILTTLQPIKDKMADTYPHLYNVLICNDLTDALWPLVREDAPREFSTLPGQEHSLLATIIKQLTPLSDKPLTLVCSYSQSNAYRKHLLGQGIGENDFAILGLPLDRGSAFSLAAAAAHIKRIDSRGIVFGVQAGIAVQDEEMWEAAIGRAYRAACEDNIALIGARPNFSSKNHGYIRKKEQLPGILNVYRVVEFLADPPGAKVARMARIGAFYYTGLMMARAGVILSEMARAGNQRLTLESEHAGRIAETAGFFAALGQERWSSPDAVKVVETLPYSSFEHAVLEVSDKAAVVDSSVTWSDFKNLKALDELAHAGGVDGANCASGSNDVTDASSKQYLSGQAGTDDKGNACVGEVVCLHSSNSTILAKDKLVAALGAKNLLIIDTPDCLLIADKGKLSSHTELVDAVRQHNTQATGRSIVQWHTWGSSTLVDSAEGFEIYRLEVARGQELPFDKDSQARTVMQVLTGRGMLYTDGESRHITPGSSFTINIKTYQSLKASSTAPLVLLETRLFI